MSYFIPKTAKERRIAMIEARARTLGLFASRPPNDGEIARRNARRAIEERRLFREALQ